MVCINGSVCWRSHWEAAGKKEADQTERLIGLGAQSAWFISYYRARFRILVFSNT
jgi:hypothetical protein